MVSMQVETLESALMLTARTMPVQFIPERISVCHLVCWPKRTHTWNPLSKDSVCTGCIAQRPWIATTHLKNVQAEQTCSQVGRQSTNVIQLQLPAAVTVCELAANSANNELSWFQTVTAAHGTADTTGVVQRLQSQCNHPGCVIC